MIVISIALAAPPDKIAERIEVGTGEVDRMSLSDDDGLVVGRTRGNGGFFVLEVDTWEAVSAEPCDVTSVAQVPLDTEDEELDEIYVGCSDGTMVHYLYDRAATGGKLAEVVDDDDAALVYTVAGDQGGAISALFWDGDFGAPNLYAFETGSPGQMHVFDATNGTVDSATNFPAFALYQNFQDAVSRPVSDASTVTSALGYIAHNGNRVSRVDFVSGTFQSLPQLSASFYDYDQLALGAFNLWAVDNELDVLLQLDYNTGALLSFIQTVTAPRAIVAAQDDDGAWLLVAGDGLRIHQLTNGSIIDAADPFYDNPSADINIVDAVASGEYAFGGGEAGKVQIITAKPWIYSGATVTPASANADDVLTVAFNVDEDSTWSICLNGDRTACADELASGEATGIDPDDLEADGDTVAVEVVVPVTEDFREGTNYLYVLAEDSEGNVGHRRLDVVVDNPPSTPVLEAGALGFSDEALVLSFQGIDDEDLASYEIFISDVPFTRQDFLDDGSFVPEDPDVEDGPTNPITVDAEAGASVSMTIGPLTNDVTYYVAVRAIDEGGQESEMSNVVTGMPEQTFTASQLADEPGGGPCSTGATGPAFWAVLAGLFGISTRRRRSGRGSLVGRALVGLGLLSTSTTALADEETKAGDITKQYGNFELRYGGFLNLQDEAITSVFGGGHNMLQVEVGPQITRFFEVDLQAGFYQELATTVTADGAASAKRTMLTMYPLGLAVSARLHIIDEQIIVPYGSYGVDFVYWTELTDDGSGGKAKVQGSKVGQHFALGAGLLLDIFAPARASLLEAYSGINDTYITFEFRRQMVDSRAHPWAAADNSGFTFTGNMITVGLKLDY